MNVFLTILCGLYFYWWVRKEHRVKPPAPEKNLKPHIYNEEAREGLHDEVLLRAIENGETPEIAKKVAAAMVQAYDRKFKPDSISDRT